MQQTDEAQTDGGTERVATVPLPDVGPAAEEGTPNPPSDTSTEADESPAPEPVPHPGGMLFDLDGTLVDTVNIRIEAWMRTFAEIGFPAERKHVAGLIGADGKRLAMEVAGGDSEPAPAASDNNGSDAGEPAQSNAPVERES